MGIYDYMNHFWFENENDPCSLSEGVLYFYLLYEANRQHWVTPFKVSTQMLAARLNTSKQNVMKARDGLRKRGLINFSKGEGKGKPALYTLSSTSTDEEMSQTLPLSQTLTLELTKSLPPKLSQSLPHSNIKEESNKEEVKFTASTNEANPLTENSPIVKSVKESASQLGLNFVSEE